MVEFVEGPIAEVGEEFLVVAVGGVGLRVAVPARTVNDLRASDKVRLLTHLILREDGIELWGFATREEREMFVTLLSVPQVGPKLAFRLVSALPPAELSAAVRQGDLSALDGVKGIGRRTAQRVMVELSEKLATWAPAGPSPAAEKAQVVVKALTSKVLGFPETEARRAVEKLVRESPDASVEELIRRALTLLAKG
ncbi:Holliday junction ATP-dependent DNA helicase RuvA [Candidatus Bipolaricaulis anaerobius]|uniref:Holliday junction branch migration complex subunit RuvA n=1 Tax=Candidatus Bipolaricaulis anaerobius TaxID=2026885 RepID=A0A2X3KIK8_9BACT|nr:Holliday junction branch migration protein RuvA [Candidatus Bipolaricaulis anaerobius]SQD92182.1 Holliday junction ATP-dependent DNA helicase RuvA [Candidatus Bipolaricaulis anaerobius]